MILVGLLQFSTLVDGNSSSASTNAMGLIAKLGTNLPAGHLHELPPLAQDRHQKAPAEMLMPARAEHAEALQAAAQHAARFPLRARQPIAECAVRVAQAEVVDQRDRVEPTRGEILDRFRARLSVS